ncbi:MAG: glycosyltransferase [Phycisphaerae bacterium]|nr:glycosyltransferase [Phycisphaerae bacterium]
MRIILFSNAYKPTISGVVTSMDHFRRGLISAGHDIHIMAPEYEDYVDTEPYVYRFPALDLTDMVDLSLALPLRLTMNAAVKGIQPHIIHSQHPAWMGDIAADYADELDIPLVFTFHTRYDIYVQKFIPLISRLAERITDDVINAYLDKCVHIVAPTPSIKEYIRNQYDPPGKISVVPTPVEVAQFSNIDGLELRVEMGLQTSEMLLYVGRLSAEKNLEFLIRAFARLASRRPAAQLVLVGKGPQEAALKRLVAKEQLLGRVQFAGTVAYEQIPEMMAAADIFVFSSEGDTQGLVLIEAMAAGTPVVAVEAPGPKDVLQAGGGVLVRSDEEAFAAQVERVLGDVQLRNRLQVSARQVAQMYAPDQVIDRMLAVYEEATTDGPLDHHDRDSSIWPGKWKDKDQINQLWQDFLEHLRSNPASDGPSLQIRIAQSNSLRWLRLMIANFVQRINIWLHKQRLKKELRSQA